MSGNIDDASTDLTSVDDEGDMEEANESHQAKWANILVAIYSLRANVYTQLHEVFSCNQEI